MVPEQAWAALLFGILSAVSLVIGAAIGVVWRPPQRAVAAIMAFGAGALLSALAFELVLSAGKSRISTCCNRRPNRRR
jgi:zinc transporter ZupT